MSKVCNSQEIREIMGTADGVFVLFYASWCPFSLAFLPVFEKHAAGRDAEFVRVLLDGNEALFSEHGVDVYPTVLFFRDGRVFKRLDGKHFAGLKERQLTRLIAACGKGRD
jgi:thioredoxin-like negative regulator of GroEL